MASNKEEGAETGVINPQQEKAEKGAEADPKKQELEAKKEKDKKEKDKKEKDKKEKDKKEKEKKEKEEKEKKEKEKKENETEEEPLPREAEAMMARLMNRMGSIVRDPAMMPMLSGHDDRMFNVTRPTVFHSENDDDIDYIVMPI